MATMLNFIKAYHHIQSDRHISAVVAYFSHPSGDGGC